MIPRKISAAPILRQFSVGLAKGFRLAKNRFLTICGNCHGLSCQLSRTIVPTDTVYRVNCHRFYADHGRRVGWWSTPRNTTGGDPCWRRGEKRPSTSADGNILPWPSLLPCMRKKLRNIILLSYSAKLAFGGLLPLLVVLPMLLALSSCGVDKHLKKGEKYLSLGEYYDAGNEFKQAYRMTQPKQRDKRGDIA